MWPITNMIIISGFGINIYQRVGRRQFFKSSNDEDLKMFASVRQS